MKELYKYYAFISYKREDEEWAKWLQHEFEHYHLPATLNGREDLPKEFRPIFRDVDELSAGNLPTQIHNALASSAFLVVVCSPLSAKSKWVNKEITDFIAIGKERGIDNVENIFPFIVDGEPHSADSEKECFPEALRDLKGLKERIGGNINESGRDKAFVKTIAGTMRIGFDSLWNRYEREKIEEEKRKREERDKLLIMQSRFLSEKVIDLVSDGDSYLARLLAIEALPKDLNDSEDRPYTPEAEAALRLAITDENAVLYRHNHTFTTARFNHKGTIVAAGSGDGSIRVLDSQTGVVIDYVSRHEKPVYSISFSPDDTLIATTSGEGEINVWYWDDGFGDTFQNLPVGGHVKDAKFSPDGNLLAASFDDGCMCLLQFGNKQFVKTIDALQIHVRSVNCVAFSPDNKLLATASDDQTIKIYHIEDKHATTFASLSSCIQYTEFSPSGEYLVAAAWDKTVRVWKVLSGEEILKIELNNNPNSASFSTNNRFIVVATDDEVSVFDAINGNKLASYCKHTDFLRSAFFSPDGNKIVSASADNTVRLWHFNLKKELVLPRGYLFAADNPYIDKDIFGPEGRFATLAGDEKAWRVWDKDGGNESLIFDKHTGNITSIAFSHDGHLIVSASYQHEMGASNKVNSFIRVWKVESGEEISQIDLSGFDQPIVEEVELNKDCSTVLARHRDGILRLFGVKDGEMRIVLNSVENHVAFARFSLCGKYIVVALEDNSICFWNLQNGKTEKKFIGHTDKIIKVAFSHDGRRMASVAEDNMLRFWNVAEVSEEYCLDCGGFKLCDIDFSPDDRYVVVATYKDNYFIWDLEGGKEVETLNSNFEFVTSVNFSPNGKYLLITPFGNNFHLIDVKSGITLQTFKGHRCSVTKTLFHPYNHKIVSASGDATIRCWDFKPLQQLIDETRERFKNRQLTPEERRKYYLE